MAMINIISIDGGGIRGLTPVLVIKELLIMMQEKGVDPSKVNILFSGTSTGGIISSFLASSPTLSKALVQTLEDLYANEGKNIFRKRSGLVTAFSLLRPKYSQEHLHDLLDYYLSVNDQDIKLSNCYHSLVVPAYDVRNGEVVIFKSRQAKTQEGKDFFLKDVAMATSAAPTYFAPYQIGDRMMVDGGIYLNNPTMAAVAEVIKHNEYYGVSKSLSDINVLSIGTGEYPPHTVESRAIWGQLQWVTKIIQIMMQGQVQATNYEASQILENYVRINPYLDRAIALDDTSQAAIESMYRSHQSSINQIKLSLSRFVEKMKKD